MATLRVLLCIAAAGVLTGLGLIGAGVTGKRRSLSATGLLLAMLSCLMFLLVGWLIVTRVSR